MAELDFEVTDEVDITDKVCPLTFVKAKVTIEELEDGEILAVRMNDGEPVQNVPRSMKEMCIRDRGICQKTLLTYAFYRAII